MTSFPLRKVRRGAPLPLDELQRLRSLCTYELLDTVAEPEYDDLTALAAQVCLKRPRLAAAPV